MHRFIRVFATVTRRVRFPGRERLLRALLPPERFRASRARHEYTVRYGSNLKLHCDLGSYVEWSVFFKGYYSPDLSILLSKLASAGMIAFDVGANVGAYSLLIADKVGPQGMVYCFEPNPEVSDRLLANIRLNGFELRTSVLNTALSSSVGNSKLFVPKKDHHNRGISSLYRYTDLLEEQIAVKVETIDNVVAELNLEHLDLVKIDTDGSDAEVIFGGRKAIETHLPIVVFEANYLAHPNVQFTLAAVRSQLADLGYRFYTAGLAGRRTPLGRGHSFPDTDIVCIPERFHQ